ncbi:MAG: hypothetical protein DRJ68_04110 [Thermoprotei archaeon]|nr:MAG: hypothetical protein DRJ62_06340 [Thermoprotei archaeon]RLF21170.1 MAG: hypothetical protein DRJ68_04110 [Thermoprotei archaeon]
MVYLKVGEQVLIDKRRDPQGNFVVLTSLSVWRSLQDKIDPELDLEGVEVVFSGEKVFLKSRSRGKLKSLVDKLRSLGITVLGSF